MTDAVEFFNTFHLSIIISVLTARGEAHVHVPRVPADSLFRVKPMVGGLCGGMVMHCAVDASDVACARSVLRLPCRGSRALWRTVC